MSFHWENPEIRAILRNTKRLGVTITEDWAVVERIRFQAHAIAGQVLTMGRWTQMSKPEGATITFDGYFLTYEELVALMREAYDAGRAEPIARGVIAMEGS